VRARQLDDEPCPGITAVALGTYGASVQLDEVTNDCQAEAKAALGPRACIVMADGPQSICVRPPCYLARVCGWSAIGRSASVGLRASADVFVDDNDNMILDASATRWLTTLSSGKLVLASTHGTDMPAANATTPTTRDQRRGRSVISTMRPPDAERKGLIAQTARLFVPSRAVALEWSQPVGQSLPDGCDRTGSGRQWRRSGIASSSRISPTMITFGSWRISDRKTVPRIGV
jgi:hypothetical protein